MDKILTNDQIYVLVQEASKKSEFKFFLEGSHGYACPLDKYTPAHIPTDFSRIIREGIYKLFSQTKDRKVITDFKQAVLDLLNGSTVQIWIAYSVCWSQFYNEHDDKSPFKVMDDDLVKTLYEVICSNEKELKLNKEWQGMLNKEGLWADIVFSNNGLKHKFGIGLF